MATALAAGFRESGVVAAARRVIVTLRCSIRLEARRMRHMMRPLRPLLTLRPAAQVPVARGGEALLPAASLAALVGIANEKFDANAARAASLFDALRRAAGELPPAADVAQRSDADVAAVPRRAGCEACGRRGHRTEKCGAGGRPDGDGLPGGKLPFRLPQAAAPAHESADASRAAVLAARQLLLLQRLAAAESAFGALAAAAPRHAPHTALPAVCRALLAPRPAAPACKAELRRRGWLDERYAPRPEGAGVLLPLSPDAPARDADVAETLSAACGDAGAPHVRARAALAAARKPPPAQRGICGAPPPPPGAEAAALAAPGARWLALRRLPGCGSNGVLACDAAALGPARLGCPLERVRLSAAVRPGDVVYDLEAATGAYLVAAAHGGATAAAAVWGCERDAALLAAAHASLRLSGGPAAEHAAARVRHADGRTPGALPPGGADRVLAPAPDGIEGDSWIRAAIAALRPRRGGVMHLRCAVASDAAMPTDAAAALAEATAERVRRCLTAAGGPTSWTVRALGAWPLTAPPGTAVVYIACEPAAVSTAAAVPSERPPAQPLQRIACPDRATLLAAVLPRQQPAILTGVPMGRCLRAWSAAALAAAAPAGGTHVSVHVTPSRTVDLAGHRAANTRRNFAFKTLPFAEAVRRCAGPDDDLTSDDAPLPPLMAPGERLYLRSVGSGREASHLASLFPALAADVALWSEEGGIFDRESYHSSVLRLSSPDTALWTHYDVMDNVLLQVCGTKRVTLLPPSAAPHLYVEGSSSRVPDLDAPWAQLAEAWPAVLAAMPMRLEGELAPGEALYIPALWFHAVTSGPRALSAAVNVFFRALPAASYDGGDPYGNRDLPAGARAAEAAAEAARGLAQLPPRYRAFYARRAAKALSDAADEAQAEDEEAQARGCL